MAMASEIKSNGSALLELFVPGRVCLFGEHSDWSGAFRRFNRSIVPGRTLVCGTNQGIYARVKRHPSRLVVSVVDETGAVNTCDVPMEAQALLREAKEGGFFSYICGVAYKVLTDYRVSGLQIDNYKTTLPLKKGLSSSAAVCVLTARSFNRAYDLKMSVRGEMECAYQGEILTPSQCGRMDQACAFGPSRVVLLEYDGEFTSAERVRVTCQLHYVVVDLCAEKDTVVILRELQQGFPHPQNDIDKGVHKLLGEKNREICEEAMKIMSSGDADKDGVPAAARLGAIMNEAQRLFDLYAGAACPSQLTAPVLHRAMSHTSLQPLIWGAKGVGAGGDGTAQFLCKSKDAQLEVARIVREELGMSPLVLDVQAGSQIRKALIPAGGFVPDLFPASQSCKAELFPVIDPRDGYCKPLLLSTVEELLASGIESVVIVVQRSDLAQFARLFQPMEPANQHRLTPQLKAYAARLVDIGKSVRFVVQEQQHGFGHAVHCAREEIGDEPFVLALGHHAYRSDAPDGQSCAQQVLAAYNRYGTSCIGLKTTQAADVSSFGCATGVWKEARGGNGVGCCAGGMLSVTRVVASQLACSQEKPSLEFARHNLSVPGVPGDSFLSMFGIYALSPRIFSLLDADLHNRPPPVNLTNALDKLRAEEGLNGILVQGRRYPLRSPLDFAQLMAATDTRTERISSEPLPQSPKLKPSAPV